METPKAKLLNDSHDFGDFPENSLSPTSIQFSPDIPAQQEETQIEYVGVAPDPEHSGQTSAPPEVETMVYKRRWYILFVFSVFASCQGVCWNTWGPIAASSEEAFGWNDAGIALLSNWGPISYLISALFFAWVIDVKGVRLSMLITGVLVTAGAGIRCITSESPYVTWTVHIGQFLNGLGGPVAMGIPPVISAIWFPAHERTTATAICQIVNYAGFAGSFLLGPYLVPDKPPTNSSSYHNNSDFYNISGPNSTERIMNEKKEIMFLLYVEFGVVAFMLLLVLIYFPDKPKLPPSTSASIQRLDFKSGLVTLLKNSKFWLICLTYGVSQGVYNAWESVLDVNLKPHNISENEAGWIGFYAVIASAGGCLIVGRLSDVYTRHMRLFLVILYIGSSLALAWFALLINGYIPESEASLYVSVILGTFLLTSTPPLYYEMACEITYPVAEGITNLWLTTMNNLGGLIFLLVQMIPNIGTAWENWCVLGTVVACIPLLGMMKESYNRLNIDDRTNKKQES